MFIAFGLEGVAIFLLITFAHIPVLFVIFSGLTFFGWGEIYSLFPATCGDLFGEVCDHQLWLTLYGTASLLVPIGSLIADSSGNWYPVFMLAIAFDWIGALLALFILKPLRKRWLVSHPHQVDAVPA